MRKLVLVFMLLLYAQVFAVVELKQSTAVNLKIGMIASDEDGITPVITLALGSADEAELHKHDGTTTVDISGVTITAITDSDGMYYIPLTTSHTDTCGELVISINDDDLILPYTKTVMVCKANYWDTKYSTDKFDTNPEEWNGTAIPADVQAGYPTVTIKDGTGTGEIDTSSGQVIVATNNDKTGYTVSTVSDKTGYSLAADQSAVTIGAVTGHTAQTGDSYAIVNNGTYGNSALKTLIDVITAYVDGIETVTDALPNAGALTDIDTGVNNIEAKLPASTIAAASDITTAHTATDDLINTAQGDLDILTGSDGVTLATAQPNYAPAKAGDAMDLIADAIDSSALATSAVAEFWAVAMSDLATPPAYNCSALVALNWVFELARNKTETTSNEISLYKADGSTKFAESDISDDSTTFTRGEYGAPD